MRATILCLVYVAGVSFGFGRGNGAVFGPSNVLNPLALAIPLSIPSKMNLCRGVTAYQ